MVSRGHERQEIPGFPFNCDLKREDTPFLSAGTGTQTCLPRSHTKGDHDFLEVIMGSTSYGLAHPFLQGKAGFLLLHNIHVRVHVNFTRVNKIEAMYGR